MGASAHDHILMTNDNNSIFPVWWEVVRDKLKQVVHSSRSSATTVTMQITTDDDEEGVLQEHMAEFVLPVAPEYLTGATARFLHECHFKLMDHSDENVEVLISCVDRPQGQGNYRGMAERRVALL